MKNRSHWATRKAMLVTAVVCLAAIAFALVAQHLWDMQPCPWCIVQRLLYFVLLILAVIGFFVPTPLARWIAGLGLITAVSGVGVAVYQSVVAKQQLTCNLTAADKLIRATGLDDWFPEIFKARASCAEAASAKLLGIPFEIASGVLFLILATWLLMVVARRERRGTFR